MRFSQLLLTDSPNSGSRGDGGSCRTCHTLWRRCVFVHVALEGAVRPESPAADRAMERPRFDEGAEVCGKHSKKPANCKDVAARAPREPVTTYGIRHRGVACRSSGICGAACAPDRRVSSAHCPKKNAGSTRGSGRDAQRTAWLFSSSPLPCFGFGSIERSCSARPLAASSKQPPYDQIPASGAQAT